MSQGYWSSSLKAISWKLLKIALGVALIYGGLYALVWIVGAFTDLTPEKGSLLTPQQFRMTAITLCGIYSFFVLVGKI